MRIHLSILAMALFASTVVAQTNQEFGLQGYQTSFTSRGGIGSATGEVHQGFHSSHWRGLAENNGNNANQKCELTQLRIITQDQNCATKELWDFVIRSGEDATGPTGGPAAILGELTGLGLPNSGTMGACAWGLTYTLAATARISVPCSPASPTNDSFWSLGCRFTASPNWTMDGHSNHTTFAWGARTHANSWISKLGDPEHAWQIIGSSTVATHPGSGRTWRKYGRTHGVTMVLGCGTNGQGGYGMGGLFPKDSTASAALSYNAKLRGGSSMAAAATVVALSLIPTSGGGWFPIVLPLGTGSRLYMATAGMLLFFGPAANGAGQSIVPLFPFIPNLGNTTMATFPLQGGMDTVATGLRLSNASAVTPK